MARITVLGGTGYAGSAIVREASRRGHDVTSVSRSAPSQPLAGVSYVAGSVLESELLAAAVAGRDVVVEAVSPRGDMAGKVEGFLDTLISLTAGTSTRLGVLGGASSLLIAPGGPRLFDVSDIPDENLPEIKTGLALLERLKAAPEDVDWFYVSPPAEFGAWAPAEETGAYRLSDDVLLRDETGRSTISAADLARAILDEIEQPKHRRRRFHAAH
ncbi:MAG: NAD(P)-dependent oxidoreductase [Actinomycetales bacterium]